MLRRSMAVVQFQIRIWSNRLRLPRGRNPFARPEVVVADKLDERPTLQSSSPDL